MPGSTFAVDEPHAILDELIQAQIGQQLSSFYKELVNQPIPQNFIDLLAKLDRLEDGT
ncbi:MAG: NepR family anti-sigma factor [Hyphomicrobiaceae bacterium]